MASTLAHDSRAALALPGLLLAALLTTIGLQTGVVEVRFATNLGFRLVRDRGPWEQILSPVLRLFDLG